MKKVILIALLLIITGDVYNQYPENTAPETPEISSTEDNEATKPVLLADNESTKSEFNSNYKCDGRTYCAQMTSCEEATFFINNCPSTKRMDANKNGVPCENRWCN